MTEEGFSSCQYADQRVDLSRMLEDCIRRFLRSAKLIGIDGPVFQTLRNAERCLQRDLAPLYPAWHVICERYRRERFDPQLYLFVDDREESIKRWGRFLYRELFPRLMIEDEFVRNVLRAVGLLPCRSMQQAVSALSYYLEEMSLPFEPPKWDASVIDYVDLQEETD